MGSTLSFAVMDGMRNGEAQETGLSNFRLQSLFDFLYHQEK